MGHAEDIFHDADAKHSSILVPTVLMLGSLHGSMTVP